MQKSKICFFNSNKDWGGGEKWHLEMACHLFSNKFDYFCKLLSRLSTKADFPINKEPLSFFSDSAKDSDNTRSLIISGMSIPGNGY